MMKHKIIGAIVWVGLAVIILPFFLDGAGIADIQPQETVLIDAPAALSQPLILAPADSVDYQSASTVTTQSTNTTNNTTATITSNNTNSTNTQTTSTNTVKPAPKSTPEQTKKSTKTSTTTTNTASNSKKPTKIRDIITKGYAVQLASFKSKSNAVALKDKLIKAKYDAFLRSKGEFTQVLVGPTFERLQSQKLLDKLKTEFKLTGFVITYTKAD